jgi:hypothetical protein
VLVGVSQSLGKIKQANSNVKLSSKHCILATNINAKPTSLMRYIARLLGAHHHIAFNAMERHKVFNDYCVVLWTFSFRKKRTNGCTNEDKVAAIAWWASKTCVSPNKRDVTRQHIEASVYDEKPTHYLMETHV